jgi:YD repeat-containing protein
MPVTGWCSYCMEPLPIDDSQVSAAPEADWGFADFEGFDPYGEEDRGAQIIAGPWPSRPVAATDPDTQMALTYATWGQRASAALIDGAVFVPAAVALALSPAIGLVLMLTAAVLSLWQMCVVQGRTGQTIGKRRVGIVLVEESTSAPIGTRRAAYRLLGHVIDAGLLGVGYLWPLWDTKHQTFADQLSNTVVVAA